jgi:hypothetical protein
LTDFDSIAQRYIDAWNETDAVARQALVAELFASDARYIDPLTDVAGFAGIDAAMSAVQAQFPDFRFRLTGEVDAHHDQLRFTWELGPNDADAPIMGFDVAVTNNGKIQSVFGFLDKVPA